jgi:hypothetical protein
VPERDRDQSIDQWLGHVLSKNARTAAQGVCLDGETIAAWTAGSLRADEAAAVERHVADCDQCQALMAAFVRTTPVAVPATESAWQRWRLGWIVPLATAATAAGIWIALPQRTPAPVSTDQALQTAARESQSVPAAPAAPPVAVEQFSRSSPRLPEAAPAPTMSEARKRADENDFAALSDRRVPAASAPLERAEQARAAAEAAGAGDAANRPAQQFAARLSIAPVEIVAPGGSARWRIINGQSVEWSTSADQRWTPVTIESSSLLSTGMAPSMSVCWMVGRGGAVYLTTDGMRFSRLPFPEVVDLVSVTATDDRTATVASADGRSWVTADRGRSWTLRTAN